MYCRLYFQCFSIILVLNSYSAVWVVSTYILFHHTFVTTQNWKISVIYWSLTNHCLSNLTLPASHCKSWISSTHDVNEFLIYSGVVKRKCKRSVSWFLNFWKYSIYKTCFINYIQKTETTYISQMCEIKSSFKKKLLSLRFPKQYTSFILKKASKSKKAFEM